jgi:hypothetical protein
MFIPDAGTSLWVTMASSTTAGIILASRIFGVQAVESFRADAASDYEFNIETIYLFRDSEANTYAVYNVVRACLFRS